MTFPFVTSVVDPLGPEGAVASALNRDVQPFEATVIGYDQIVLTWKMPIAAAWSGLSVTRSRSGFPRTYDDGEQVLQYTMTDWNLQPSKFEVTNLIGGWHYFSLFLKDAFGVWQKVAEVDALVPYDYGSTDRMWDTIPEYYKVIRDDTADKSLVNLRINPDLYDGIAGGSESNLLLSAFISLFGWGFDLLRTETEYLAHGYDPTVIHTSRLQLLAQQFGHDPEASVPAAVNRTLVRNLSSLYRKRGTLDGIKELVTSVSGWDVEVLLGPNMMLNEDQAAQTNPVAASPWLSTVRYNAGDLVTYGDYTYFAVSNNTLATPPPNSATNSASWTYVDYPRVIPTGTRADTGDVSTWQVWLDNFGTDDVTPGRTKMVAGAPDITGTKRQTTALQISRVGSTGPNRAEVRSYPSSYTPAKPARLAMLESAIPIPRPVKWDTAKQYAPGDYVIYKAAAYEALNKSVGVTPTTATDWLRVGADDRINFTVSTYAHGPFIGTAGTGGKTVEMQVFLHNADGSISQTLTYADFTALRPSIYDPFIDDATTLSGTRVAATGQTWSSDGVGTWSIDRNDSGGWVTPPASGKTQRWINNGTTSSYSVGVTWTLDPGTTRLGGLIFRRVDANNYWIATQTGLFKVVGGAAKANPSTGAVSWTKFTTGDKMSVLSDHTNAGFGNVITVYKNGVAVGATTDNFNGGVAGSNNVGLGMEA